MPLNAAFAPLRQGDVAVLVREPEQEGERAALRAMAYETVGCEPDGGDVDAPLAGAGGRIAEDVDRQRSERRDASGTDQRKPRAVAPAGPVREAHLADAAQEVAPLNDPVDDHVDELDAADYRYHRRRHDRAALGLEAVRPEDAVRHPGLVLDGDEQHALRRAGLPTDQDCCAIGR